MAVWLAGHSGRLPAVESHLYERTTNSRVVSTLTDSKMAKSLAKVQKKISKKKRKINSLHENSRDSQKLRRAGARSEKLERVSAARAKANQPHCKLKSICIYSFIQSS